ncbi:DeoR family transcriptional regulator [Nitritalea halalkaliphila LW7]|uniref:DeoR family transcriptional regulator n=1 Tax=Nitritalea halalkaliphila LW7 TaxID=1189621 RepID=I5BW53_9BACT|nr:DeoR/GlpR family DNA-binding transcription regulator [Nitritalea halalkaliphila]EIM73805.1 DeoR family transcriptional regulator [Nitritalea halalkaliphila LW7]
MLKEERHAYILQEVRVHHRILLADIADTLQVSVDTIRRDVKELDEAQLVKKVHGGAVSLDYNIYNYVAKDNFLQQKKSDIAKKAVRLLRDDMVILMGGGTTNIEVVKHFPPNIKLTVFTPSLPLATQLIQHPTIKIIFLGGVLSKDAQISVGADTILALQQLRVDLCFLGTGYLSVKEGLTEYDYEVVQVKKAMIERAKKTMVLTVSAKLNSVQRFQTCPIQDIDTLITELDPEDATLTAFREAQIQLL